MPSADIRRVSIPAGAATLTGDLVTPTTGSSTPRCTWTTPAQSSHWSWAVSGSAARSRKAYLSAV
jgi:hypothetical protein